jgi:hypothetical protein
MEILAAILFSYFFTSFHQLHIKLRLNFRPFDCSSCLASWVALGLFFLPDIYTNCMITMFGAGVLAPLFTKLYDKIYFQWIR